MASPRPVPRTRWRRCGLDLREPAEQLLLHVGADADAGIADVDPHRGDAPVLQRGGRVNGNLSHIGKLHRVREQVEQNLPHAVLVGDHVGHAGVDHVAERETLPRRCLAHRVERFLNGGVQRKPPWM